MEELKFFVTLTNDVDALEVESLELLHPVVVPHLLLPYHYPTPPHPAPNPTHTPLAAKGMELEVPLPPSAERRAGDELQRLLKYPSLDNCQLMVWKQLAHCNGNLVPVNHSIPLKARFSLCSGSLCLILRLMVEGATEAAVLTFLPSVAAPCDLRDHTTLFPNNRWLRLFWGGWGWGDATAGGD